MRILYYDKMSLAEYSTVLILITALIIFVCTVCITSITKLYAKILTVVVGILFVTWMTLITLPSYLHGTYYVTLENYTEAELISRYDIVGQQGAIWKIREKKGTNIFDDQLYGCYDVDSYEELLNEYGYSG